MRAAGWLGRTLLLILAGLATLSIIGAIAAIPSGGPRGMIAPIEQAAPNPSRGPGATDGVIEQAALRPSQSSWLEPLTYAMIAVAGFAAAGLIVLMRIAAHLKSIAERNEM